MIHSFFSFFKNAMLAKKCETSTGVDRDLGNRSQLPSSVLWRHFPCEVNLSCRQIPADNHGYLIVIYTHYLGNSNLGGGFKYFLFSPLFGEAYQFD